MFTIFPISRFGWVNLLAACGLLFILVLLYSSGLCLAVLYLCVFYNVSLFALGLLLPFGDCYDWSYWF